ncbi:hypothetical protein [Streptomyces chryseus]|uniref:hypothetical protein n=1 Tax=Streptomyces chryseus TaxID=68186 RepID=UPI00110FF780|nr:hypothetical protein [Streptomyces chryseus]GGX42889.1 hypothetical protein GCM10010353_67530 [Streptomyces chryseus]
MAVEPDNTPIQSRYAQQYGADLAANREEQEKLAERLKQLRADEAWLLQQLETREAGAPAEAAASQTVPQQRQVSAKATRVPSSTKKKTTRAKAPTKSPARKASAPKAKPGGDKATVEKTANQLAETVKRVEPPLHEVVLSILRTQPGHPHVAREVYTELADKHGRSTSIQVVRNSLESLVKKGTVEKENKQNSVMYTAPAGGTVDAVSEPAVEKVSEKVTADVQ